METRTVSAHEALKTRYCQRPACGEVADGKSQWCVKHKATLAGRDPDQALREAIANVTGTDPPRAQEIKAEPAAKPRVPELYVCKTEGCTEPSRSPVGPYSHCAKHREERQRAQADATAGFTGAVATTPLRVAVGKEFPQLHGGRDRSGEQQLREAGMYGSKGKDVRTHEERTRSLTNAARALDRAETRLKVAQKGLRDAKKAYAAAIAELTGASGVTLADE